MTVLKFISTSAAAAGSVRLTFVSSPAAADAAASAEAA